MCRISNGHAAVLGCPGKCITFCYNPWSADHSINWNSIISHWSYLAWTGGCCKYLIESFGYFRSTRDPLIHCWPVCLYFSFHRSKMIPRWLTIWCMIGVVPDQSNAILYFFHVETGLGINLVIPLSSQEIVIRAWMIFVWYNKGAMERLDEST